jgi:hypothetical protein
LSDWCLTPTISVETLHRFVVFYAYSVFCFPPDRHGIDLNFSVKVALNTHDTHPYLKVRVLNNKKSHLQQNNTKVGVKQQLINQLVMKRKFKQ